MTCEYTGILKWLYNWQTLIAGLLALGAAWLAARPVWRQLTLSARETLVMRVSAMESKQDTTRRLMASITAEFMSHLGPPYGDDRGLDPHPEWASEAENRVDSVVETLTTHQETSLDGELVDSKRKDIIQECGALSRCLSKIHAPYSIDFGGFEAPPEGERQAFEERGHLAARELESHTSAVARRANELDGAFLATLKQLRKRIQGIDNL
jgi:hypothetical protein